MSARAEAVPPALVFTGHAAERLQERDISERAAADVLAYGEKVHDDGGKAVYRLGRVNVVLGTLGGARVVITAYRERKRNPKRSLRKIRRERKRMMKGLT